LKVSIVVPVFNVPVQLLSECLTAVGRQTLRSDDHEIVIVDDASTDGAVAQLIDQFAAERDNCSVVRHDENRGLNQARLAGVRESRGEFVLFVDGDDILTRDAAELLYLEGIRTNADVVSAPFYRWSPETVSYYVSRAQEQPQALSERMKVALSGAYSFTMCGRLFRRTLLSGDIFDMPALPHEDLVTTVRLLFKAYRVAAVAQPIYYYSINPASITRVFTAGHIDGVFYALNDWYRLAEARGMAAELESSMQQGAERLVDMVVLRRLRSGSLTLDEKVAVLGEIDRRYDSLPIPRPEPTLPGTRILAALGSQDAARTRQVLDAPVPSEPWSSSSGYKRTLGPSDMARRLKGKIVIIGQVDYQVRNAARLARALRQRGHPCAVMDNSAVADEGRRQTGPDERNLFWRTEHIKIREKEYGTDWLSSASLVIAFNDFTPMFREALEYRHRLGLPTVCIVEGINDFLRVDFHTPRQLPYRRCDYVFLAGADDEQYFADRPTFVVGIPNVEALAAVRPLFPSAFHVVLNVNFTYGALEGKRNEFVRAAQEAFDKLGVSWEITRHPMDDGDLTGMPVSESTQQELIDRCSVFVSRFATGILEALASGKPVIYFNPHGEQVAKFNEPLGAFEIARSSIELADALRRVEADIAAGVDFRSRAANFLQRHAAFGSPDGTDVGDRFASAVWTVLDANDARLAAASTLFLERYEELEPFRQERPGLVLGDFARSHGAQLNEEEMIGRCFGSRDGLMIDVGANFGNSADVYLGKGWTVHAFEPDPNNRAKLELLWPGCERLLISPEAVSDRDGLVVPLYASDESTGISSLSAFTDGHRHVAEVSTVTLATYLESAGIEHVDFLKVDVEGFDKFVLDGFPWDRDHPDAILVEFEDTKTVPLGYDVGDLVELLQREGYIVYVSEWHPIVRYGISHDWKSLSRYDPDVDLSGTWGNLVGFREDPGDEVLAKAVNESVRFAVKAPQLKTVPTHEVSGSPVAMASAVAAPTSDAERAPQIALVPADVAAPASAKPVAALSGRRRYRNFANGLRRRMPTVFRLAQVCAWELRAARRHWVATTAIFGAIAVTTLLPVVADEPDWRPWSWSVAAILIVLAGALAFGAALREVLRRVARRQDRALTRSQRDVRRLDAALASLSARHASDLGVIRSSAEATREETSRALARSAKQVRVVLDETLSSATERHAREVGELQAAVDSLQVQVTGMQEAIEAERHSSNYSNITGFRAHDRYFSAEDAAHAQSYWLPRFGLSMFTRQLMYLAHDICRAEDRCEGRLATTVHAAMVRSLALTSLGSGRVELLEIGTLFGVGAGALYRTGIRVGQRVQLTLVDPLDGYYNRGLHDSTTGVPVTRDVLSRNLKAMSVSESDVRFVIGKSGDDEVLAEVSDRTYDYLLIDGDHTLGGVAADFARYGGLVRPGGLLVFDDYDTAEWPQIKTFVDRHVLGSRDWECVGTGWRTAVFARVGAKSAVGSEA
jgi:FkbM family methyltransferase